MLHTIICYSIFMKKISAIFCIALSFTLSLAGMDKGDALQAKLIAQSKDKKIGVAQSPADTIPFSLYKVESNGKSTGALYAENTLYPIGSMFALHTTRGIFITNCGFAVFDKRKEVAILTSAHEQYATIFADRDALNSLCTNFSLDMPSDTTTLIASCHGVCVYNLETDRKIAFLPPYSLPLNKTLKKIIPLFYDSTKKSVVHRIAYNLAVYLPASKTVIGFNNPLSTKKRRTRVTVAQKIVKSELLKSIESVEYAKAHDTQDFYAFGNSTKILIDTPIHRFAILAREIGNGDDMSISAIDFVPNTEDMAIALNMDPSHPNTRNVRGSKIVVISSKGLLKVTIDIIPEFSGITKIDVLLGGSKAILWNQKKHGEISIIPKDAAQDTKQSTQHS